MTMPLGYRHVGNTRDTACLAGQAVSVADTQAGRAGALGKSRSIPAAFVKTFRPTWATTSAIPAYP